MVDNLNSLIIIIFVRFNNRRQKHAGNINLYIVLDTGFQPSFHVHPVVVAFVNIRHARRIGNGLDARIFTGQQVYDLHHFFTERFASVSRRCINMPYSRNVSAFSHFHLLVVF